MLPNQRGQATLPNPETLIGLGDAALRALQSCLLNTDRLEVGKGGLPTLSLRGIQLWNLDTQPLTCRALQQSSSHTRRTAQGNTAGPDLSRASLMMPLAPARPVSLPGVARVVA